MTTDKNTIIAIVLSAIVLIGWQYFFASPQMQRQKEAAQQQQQQQAQTTKPPAATSQQSTTSAPATPSTAPLPPGQPATTATPAQTQSRETVLAATPRIAVDTPSVHGSINLKGGRIDDLALVKYRETTDPKSPPIVLLSPSGSLDAFYAEFGWVGAPGAQAVLPNADTVWKQDGSGALGIDHPVTLTYDNGQGLTFRRTITVDDKYMFTVKDEVANNGTAPVTLYPFALISRHGLPPTQSYSVLHEGPIGVMGDKCLRQSGFSISLECHEENYKTLEDKKSLSFNVSNAWFGFTDKYWAALLVPATDAKLQARFSSGEIGTVKTYQADYLEDSRTVAPGANASASARLFAGAREVRTVNFYDNTLHLNRFELLIDWGILYFITKPMFWSLDYVYRFVGNFGLAILIVTICIKILFFPLANKSYASMAKMKAVQPMMAALRERYPDDKMKQQQEMMEIYRKEKINPLAGCLPIVVQIPVFFSLYKVLFVTIEMRHAPFFGWIHDLSSQDPTNVFTLFGLLAWDPTTVPFIGHFLHLGAWPLLMGMTMWFQMKLNPTPPDPTQAMIFNWMPVIFTFMLASFPAGLVIYWAWNNTLSVAQQSVIMRRNGAKIELFDNIKALFVKKKATGKTGA